MAFSVAGLTGWVNENKQDLLTQMLIGSQTASLVTVIPGNKYKMTVKYLETTATIQAGGCGYTTNGTTTLSDKEISVVSLKSQESLCPDDLELTSMQLSMNPGKNTKIPFEQLWAERKVKQLQTANETMIWSATSGTTTKCAGFKYLADNDSAVQDYSFNVATTGYTSTTWLNAVYAMFNKLSADAKSKTDLTLFTSYETFNYMIQCLVIGNLYHIDMSGNSGIAPFIFPGTSIKVQPIKAISGYMLLTPASNLIISTDLLSDSDNFKVWYSEDNRIVQSSIDYKLGTSYYWGDEIVLAQ